MKGLSANFMQQLQNGILFPFLKRVQQDATLDLEIRNNYINIYYRGGNVYKIKEESNATFSVYFNTDYFKTSRTLALPPSIVSNRTDSQLWLEVLPSLKDCMDIWFGENPKNEREFQQLVVRENNSLNDTDYFIIDIEYDERNNQTNQASESKNTIGRYDLLAVEWESTAVARKLQKNHLPKLVFVEMKYGDSALDGNAGMVNHVLSFQKFISSGGLANLKDEMLTVFKQKRELGLIKGLDTNRNVIAEFATEIDFVFLLANHDPAKSKLKEVLDDLIKLSPTLGFEIKFCVSNFMGYGLYKQSLYSLVDFHSKFTEQIFS